jgi:hypothetical protein
MTDLMTRIDSMSDGEGRKRGVEAEREPNFLLARFARPFLPWAAGKLPRRILPDDLTALGVLAAFGVCAAYQLSNQGRGWLWVASGLLVVQWIGDSLDGPLARVRGGPTEIRLVLILLNTARVGLRRSHRHQGRER